MESQMPQEYLELAKKRVSTKWPGYTHPEDHGYDFTSWVSPYTKGAHQIGEIAIVLQDWTSAEAIGNIPDKEIQEYGRTLKLKTNLKIEALLDRIFGLKIQDTYSTNVFPFIKPGNISNTIPSKNIKQAAELFLKSEMKIVQPKIILALGNLAFYGLKSAGINSIHLPHPAARIGTIEIHEKTWRDRIAKHNT